MLLLECPFHLPRTKQTFPLHSAMDGQCGCDLLVPVHYCQFQNSGIIQITHRNLCLEETSKATESSTLHLQLTICSKWSTRTFTLVSLEHHRHKVLYEKHRQHAAWEKGYHLAAIPGHCSLLKVKTES